MTPPETFPPVTLGHICRHGCRDLLVYCQSGRCHHSAVLNADWLPDETPVRTLCSRMICTLLTCGPGLLALALLLALLLFLLLRRTHDRAVGLQWMFMYGVIA